MNFKELKNYKKGKVHFIGIGGIGMSALAFILRNENIAVQGSDMSENYLTPKLREKGVTYFVGHKKENVTDDVVLVVQTSIIKSDNPEILAAKEKGIEIITRANLLAQVMAEKKGITIAGTHGKTSTTAMTSLVLEVGDLDPTVINGGIIHYFGCNSKSGKGDYLVAESDESDASFVELPSFIGAITNIEPEHLEHSSYNGSFETQKSYFERYIKQIPADGACVICVDDKESLSLYEKLKNDYKNLISYSIKVESNADLVAKNITMDMNGLSFDVDFKNGNMISDVKMPIYGLHNVSNALVAIAIGKFLNVSDEKIKKALSLFTGVKRRFTKVGEYNGVVIIDDYGHHPTEIKVVLETARALCKGKVYTVFQPHKYSRVKALFNEFCNAFSDCDTVIVSDVYSVGQPAIIGATQDDLILGIEKNSNKNVIKLASEKDLAKALKSRIRAGDMIVCFGAGTITYWAQSLAEQLKNS
ncbi:MAG: UDP-N-acetylmuramate--L-alanine ligase [Pelagibacterales bacterium]|nr:UDP-N-acetylmuramate--L-alanine ligase [Pelagibacterales bacterium]